MTSESTRTTENEALGKKIGAIENEVATVKIAIRRASRTRLALLVAVVAVIGISVWMFYNLARSFASEETLNLFAEKAKERIEDSSPEALKQVQRLQKTALPKLQEAFNAQVEKDRPKFMSALEMERDTLLGNLQNQLEVKIKDHMEGASDKYQAILQDEFPELEDPELLDDMFSSIVNIMDRLAEEYYSDKIRGEIEGLNEKWDNFEMADVPGEGEPRLEQQFLAALLNLAAMKVDDQSVE